jgi:signal transduction histidine kinase
MPDVVRQEVKSELRPATLPAKVVPVDSKLTSIRVNWQLKAIAPVALVLLAGLMLFILATVSLRDPQRHAVLVLAGGGAIAVCATLIFVLAWFVQRPMVELQEKIARVGEGDLDVSVSFAKRNDEIGSLGRNFNQMVAQLRESRYEIQHMHQTQISRAEYFATLGELAAGLAHEIRNPLAGIAGVVEVIARDLPATSPARPVVKDVRVEIAQINRILTDLLQTVRPHRPDLRFSDLNTTVEDAVIRARQQALSKSIEIVFKKDSTLPEIEHDSNQVRQVLLNLLLNAIQSIDGHGRITVETKASTEGASISISDNGRGISPEHLPNIFRPFYTTKGGGTGLGLSFARRIVEEHMGRIDVTSVVGEGTQFMVSLPLSRPVAQRAVS